MSIQSFNRRALSSKTSHPNSPETDLLAEVEHDVDVIVDEHGTIETVRFLAACPLAAMDAIAAMNDEAFRQLARVPTT